MHANTCQSHTSAHAHSHSSSGREEITLVAVTKTPTTSENLDFYHQVEPWKRSHMCSCRGQWAECKLSGTLVVPQEVYHKFRYSKNINIPEVEEGKLWEVAKWSGSQNQNTKPKKTKQ